MEFAVSGTVESFDCRESNINSLIHYLIGIRQAILQVNGERP